MIVTRSHGLLFHKRSTDWDSPWDISHYTRRISLLLTLILGFASDLCNNNDILLVVGYNYNLVLGFLKLLQQPTKMKVRSRFTLCLMIGYFKYTMIEKNSFRIKKQEPSISLYLFFQNHNTQGGIGKVIYKPSMLDEKQLYLKQGWSRNHKSAIWTRPAMKLQHVSLLTKPKGSCTHVLLITACLTDKSTCTKCVVCILKKAMPSDSGYPSISNVFSWLTIHNPDRPSDIAVGE